MKKNDYSQHKVLADFEVPAIGARYVVTGNVAEGSDLRTDKELLSGIIMSEIDMVTKNSEPMNLDKIAAEDLFSDAVMAFINDDEQIVVHEVCSEIRDWKDRFQSYTFFAGGRSIPNLAVNRWGEIAELEALSKGGNAYYGSAEATLLLSPKGQVLTDIDAFYLQALADEDEKNSLVYCSTYMREFLRELVERRERQEKEI